MEDLKKLLAAATPGPWYVGHNELGDAQGPMSIWPDANMIGAIIARCGPQQPWQGWYEQPAHDAALIVAAINALPELLDRVERLEADMQVIAFGSRIVANADNTLSHVDWTREQLVEFARAALAKDATT
jgi:NADPH-dependent ferric siderophore reductase